jgi:Tol biopolymer transport system component
LERVHEADWSPDGQSILAVQFSGGKDQLQYPVGKVLYEAPGWITFARISPKGNLIAFCDHPVLGDISGSVCVVDLTGKKKTLSSGWKRLAGLVWSPSGDEVWFTGSKAGKGGGAGLYSVSISGREREIYWSPSELRVEDISRQGQKVLITRGTPRAAVISLAPSDSKERDLAWFDYSTVADLSLDGKTLLFYEWGFAVKGAFTVYLRKTDGSDAVRLGEGKPLALAPDGRWALTVQKTPPEQLVLLPIGAGQQKALPRGSIGEYYDWAAWSPDGSQIFFAGAERGHPGRTYGQDIEGGPPRPVTTEGMVGTALSPDGKLLVAIDRYGEYYLCPVNGGEARAIEGLAEGDVVLQWTADGRSLFVRGAGDLDLKLFKLDLATGRREAWKVLRPPDPAAVIGIALDPGQVRLTPDGRYYAYTSWTFPSELYLGEGLK